MGSSGFMSSVSRWPAKNALTRKPNSMSLISAIQPTYASGIPTPVLSSIVGVVSGTPVTQVTQWDNPFNIHANGTGFELLSRVFINGVEAVTQTRVSDTRITFTFPVPQSAGIAAYEITVRTPGVPESNAVSIDSTTWTINNITGTNIVMAYWFVFAPANVVLNSISGGRFEMVSSPNFATVPDPTNTEIHNTVDPTARPLYKATHSAFDGQGCIQGYTAEGRWAQTDEHGAGTATTFTDIVVGYPATPVSGQTAVLFATYLGFDSGDAAAWNSILAPSDDGPPGLFVAYDGVGAHFANLTAPSPPIVDHAIAHVFKAEFVGTTSSAFYIDNLKTPKKTGLSVAKRVGPLTCFAYYNRGVAAPHLLYLGDGGIAEIICYEGVADLVSTQRTANYLHSKYPSTGVNAT